MPDQQNVQRGRLWRSVVASTFRLYGFTKAEPRPSSTFRERLDQGPTSDILGIPGVYVSTRSDLGPDWGPSLDAAEQSAQMTGADLGLVIQYRRFRDDPSDAFAVLSLRGLAGLLSKANYPLSLEQLETDIERAIAAMPEDGEDG